MSATTLSLMRYDIQYVQYVLLYQYTVPFCNLIFDKSAKKIVFYSCRLIESKTPSVISLTHQTTTNFLLILLSDLIFITHFCHKFSYENLLCANCLHFLYAFLPYFIAPESNYTIIIIS